MSHDLIALSATAVRTLLRAGEITSVELVEAAADRIAVVEPKVNAVPTLCLDRAMDQARAADVARRAGHDTILSGIPIVVKDNNDVAGTRNTGGTPIFRDRVSATSDRTVAQMETNGAVVLGKANLSELGGAQTTNAVHGTTLNPYDTRLTCGGSSGGSAVALATGEAWLAHGNDYGGSLRIPAAFCNVLGLRPTPGRVPRKRLTDPFDTIFVEGPMARSVDDLALLFDAMVGYDPGDFLSRPASGPPAFAAARDPRRPARIAISPDLGLPVETPVRAAVEIFADTLERAGVAVHRGYPATTGAMDAFRVLRGESFFATWEPLLDRHRDLFPPAVMGDILRGRDQPGRAIAAANRVRTDFYRRAVDFLDTHEFLVCPATQTMPFAADILAPETVAGETMPDYLGWIAITAIWSLSGLPAISVPIGFSPEGLPIGVQILTHGGREADLFRLAAWIERELALPTGPVDPR
ncbi:amidase [Phreatobacter cathodiphilus]|uniref:Indoleacetamide hydrolase n=1 Tax=Phreatobacter cathodiphilus TaxID=1868589 RepID=A0A2S0N8X0_9HYPH|nr:amidase [Phreatobacter cathodiphilus]AVO44373.1 amidase [Phreatobacter cathodiphilus]